MADLYAFDTNSLRVFGNYYPASFPTFWDSLNNFVRNGRVTSVREVFKELELQSASDHLNRWATTNDHIFLSPSEVELDFVAEIFKVAHFRQLIGQRQQLKGLPVADPFLVARGKVHGCCVVTEEASKPNAAKIPNVCDHFGVAWTNVEGFLKTEGWRF